MVPGPPHIEAASEHRRRGRFEAVRQQYGAKAPLLEMHGTSAPRSNPPPTDAPRTSLTTLHVLAWDARRAARPLRNSVLVSASQGRADQVGTYASGLDELKITLTAAEIERYGPGIIMDISRAGRDRALLWVE